MTRMLTIAAAAATVFASPAFAACAGRSETPAYRVSFDAARQLYCLRVFDNAAIADPRPDRRGIECLSEARWAERGIRFARVGGASSGMTAD